MTKKVIILFLVEFAINLKTIILTSYSHISKMASRIFAIKFLKNRMKFIYSLLFFCAVTLNSNAQNMKGIWRGYFEQVNINMFQGAFSKERYKYEVQIDQLMDNALKGVTYSYHNTDFYAKVTCNGIFQPKRKTIVLKELKVIEVKKMSNTSACAMTCYLDYTKDGDLETLTGTYTSVNMDNKEDCGSGTVYLERVTTTKFKKEPFLLNDNKNDIALKPKTPNNKPVEKLNPSSNNQKNSTKVITSNNKTLPNNKTANIPNKKNNTAKPGAEEFVIKKDTVIKKNIDVITLPKKTIQPTVNNLPKNLEPNQVEKVAKEILPIPKILQERTNKVNATLEVDAKDVTLEFYDNGEIDGDYISVYKDNKKLVDNQILGLRPITLKLKFDDENTIQEIITVAESLGKVPPNTAFLVVTFGDKREEILLTSDNSKNASIIITYKSAKRIK